MKNIIKYSFLLTLFVLQQSSAATKTFTGIGNWYSYDAWLPAGSPESTDDIIIPNGKSLHVNVNNGQCRSLTIQSGGTLIISNSKKITINNTSGLIIEGTLEINGGNIVIAQNNTNFTILSGGKVIWAPETNNVANTTLFTKCIENFAATSTLEIKKWYNLNVGIGSVISGDLGNLTIVGVVGWQMKNTLESCKVRGTLSLSSSYVILDNTGAISNTTIGKIALNNSSSYLDFYNGTHPGSFIVNTGDVTINAGELNCLYTSGTGTCTFNLNGTLSMINQAVLYGTNGHNGSTKINISGDANLNKSYFYGVHTGSGNSTINIGGNLTTQKGGSNYSEFYGIVNGNGNSTIHINGDFNNQGYFDLIWNSGYTGIGNGNCNLTVDGAFTQSDGDFRGIWNATTSNSGSCNITLGSLNYSGGIFMISYSCAEAGVEQSLTVKGITSIAFGKHTDIFRGNGLATLSGKQNFSSCTLNFNGFTSISGNTNAEFISNAGYGNEVVSFATSAIISGGDVYFGYSNHDVAVSAVGNFVISGGSVDFSYASGNTNMNFQNDFTITGGTINLKNNTGKTSVSISGAFLMSNGTLRLYGNNSVNNTDSTSLRTYGDFSHSGGKIQFSNNSNSVGSTNLFIHGDNFNLSGNGTMTSAGEGTSANFGKIYFGNSINTNYNRTSANHIIQQIKYVVFENSKVKAIAGPIQISSHAASDNDYFNILPKGTLIVGNNSIVSNEMSANSGIKVGANGTLFTANPNGLFDGTLHATIASSGNMNYSLDPTSTIVYNGSDNQKISGYGNGIATGTQHQYGNLTIDFSGTPDDEYAYLERNTIIRGVLNAQNGELKLNGYSLTAESAVGSGIGYVKSEDNLAVNPSRLKIGYSPSNKNLVFPFGRSSSEVIYMNLNITNNPGSGYITISTRRSEANNTPLPGTDNVKAITKMNPDGADESTTHAIDRWWEVNAPGVTAEYVLRYSGAENTTTESTATGSFKVQFWNGENFKKFNSTGNGVTNGVGSITANLTNINGPLVLSAGSASHPIQLAQFDAKASGTDVEITWTTEEEINNDFFSIERSEDGQSFEKIKEIDGAGNSNQILKYITLDDHPLPNLSFYRLKQTGFDGKFTYSSLKAINRGMASISNDPAIEIRTLGPNPFTDQFKVEYKLSQAGKTSLMILNMNGQVVFETSKNDDRGNNSFIFTDDKNLPPANYILQITNGIEKATKKIVKK